MTGVKTHNFIDAGTGKSVGAEYVTDGVAKAMIRADTTLSTISTSFNVSSLDDDGTGLGGVNFTSAFDSVHYIPSGDGVNGNNNASASQRHQKVTALTTGDATFKMMYSNSSTDWTHEDGPPHLLFTGDLA